MAKDVTRSGKLAPFFEGPFKVARRNKGGAYLLLDHDGVLLNRNYAPSQLLAVPSPRADNLQPGETHTVDHIVNHRSHGRGYQYLVRWKGCDAAADTWEPASHFYDVSVISDYWKQHRA